MIKGSPLAELREQYSAPVWVCDVLHMGETIDDWIVDSFVGNGGFGTVCGVHNCQNRKRRAVIKIFAGDLTSETGKNGNLRIKKEAEILASLKGKYAPRIYGKGEFRGRQYFVMEEVEPLSLESKLLPESRIRRLLRDVTEDLEALHGIGWLHNDLKHENIAWRGRDRRYILIDFGGAVQIDDDAESDKHVPRENSINYVGSKYAVPGTTGFVPPELSFKPYRDIYALGHVIRNCFGENVPLEWSEIVNKCICHRPNYRYQDVVAIRDDIKNLKTFCRDKIRRNFKAWSIERLSSVDELNELPRRVMSWDEFKRVAADLLPETKLAANPGVEDIVYFEFPTYEKIRGKRRARLRINTPVRLGAGEIMVLSGPGMLEADISVSCKCKRTKDRPHVVLVNGAVLINKSNVDVEKDGVDYGVGEFCRLIFPKQMLKFSKSFQHIKVGGAGQGVVSMGTKMDANIGKLIKNVKKLKKRFVRLTADEKRQLLDHLWWV